MVDTDDEWKYEVLESYKPPLPSSMNISHMLMHSQISLYQPETSTFLCCEPDSPELTTSKSKDDDLCKFEVLIGDSKNTVFLYNEVKMMYVGFERNDAIMLDEASD